MVPLILFEGCCSVSRLTTKSKRFSDKNHTSAMCSACPGKLQLAPVLAIFSKIPPHQRLWMLQTLKRLWKKVFGWWMTFAHFLGRVNTSILLTVMYVLIIGPSWIVVRVLRKDLLRRRLGSGTSYWIDKAPLKHTLEETRHQF
jgi:hypothetical protein